MPVPMPVPILPQYAYPTPAPLPPAPAWPAPLSRPAPATLPVTGFEHDVMETVRVRALPPPSRSAPDRGAPASVVRRALPFGAIAIAVGCLTGYLLHHRVPVASAAAAAPIVMSVSPPAAQADGPAPPSVAAVAAGATPTVAAIAPVAEAEPVTEAAPEAEPVTEAAPEAAPEAEAVAVSDPEIEMAATPVAKHHHHHHHADASSARMVARTPRAVARPATSSRRAVAADPIAAALAEPTRSARTTPTGTGPARVTITSTPAALIYIDGRSTNLMTPRTLPLAAGTHKITLLELTSRKAKTQEIDVAARRPRRDREEVLSRRGPRTRRRSGSAVRAQYPPAGPSLRCDRFSNRV